MNDAQRLANLTEAMVEDILKAPDEDILLEELASRFEKLREERDFIKAQLAGERANIAGWINARDAQLSRALAAEQKLQTVRRDALGALRMARCPSDGRSFVGECYDAKTCGCSIGLHLAALTQPTEPT